MTGSCSGYMFNLFILIEVNLHNIIFTILIIFKVYSSVAFSTFTMLYNHHHYLIPEHFQNPPPKPPCHEAVTPYCPLLHSLPVTNLSVSMICLFWTVHINGLIQDVALCVWLLSLSVMLSVLHFFLWMNNIPLYGHIFYLFIHQCWTFRLFLLFGCYE